MSEAELAFALNAALLVDDVAVLFNDTHGDATLRRGHRNGQAGGHVLRNAGGSSAQGDELIAGGF
jgi:hypothetical protein